MGQSQEFLKEYCEQWKKFAIFTFCMKKIFEYLDRYHLKNAGALSLTDTALEYIRKNIFTSRITQLRRCILDEIEKDRQNEIIDKDLLKEAVLQYIYMGFEKRTVIKREEGSSQPIRWTGEKNLMKYDVEFEAYLLKATTEFYRKQSDVWSSTMSASEYIQKISFHLKKEEDNADYFLQEQSKSKVVDILLKEAVENQAETLTQKDTGCQYMFTENKID